MGGPSTLRFTITLIFQSLLLFFDMLANAFWNFASDKQLDILILYMVQDFCLIISLIILLINIFATHIFQIGLIQILFIKFRVPLFFSIFYIVLSISLHTWHIKLIWDKPVPNHWSADFWTLFVIHRSIAILYCIFYKRAAERIADPRYYKGSNWLNELLNLN